MKWTKSWKHTNNKHWLKKNPKNLNRHWNNNQKSSQQGNPNPVNFRLHGGSDGKESACNAWDLGLIPRSRRFPGEGNGYPLQYSCLENSTDRGVWQTTVHCGLKEWDMTEWLTLSLFWWHLFIKNPKDTVQYILKPSLCFFLEPHIKETKNAELILMQVWKKCQMNKSDIYF